MEEREADASANPEREKGVASQPCPTCGNSLNAIELPDGAVSFEACRKCYPEATPEKASSNPFSRELGSAPVAVTGNYVVNTGGEDGAGGTAGE